MDSSLERVQGVRDDLFFREAVNRLWTTICMGVDLPEQQRLMGQLKSDIPLLDPVDHAVRIRQYGEALGAVSSYPVYQRVSQELRNQHYGAKVVSNWNVGTNGRKVAYNPEIPNLASQIEDIYPNMYHPLLFGRAFIQYGIRSRAFHDQLDRLGAQHLQGYVGALELINAARSIVFDKLVGQVDLYKQAQRGEITVYVPDIETKFRALLKSTHPFEYVAAQLDWGTRKKEKELFGNDAEIAGQFWRTLTYLRNSNLPEWRTLPPLREAILQALLQGEYETARQGIEQYVAKYPRLIPQFAYELLHISPREQKKVQSQQDEELEAEKLASFRQREDLISRLRSLIGQKLTTPDGKYSITITTEKQNTVKEGSHFYFSGAEFRRAFNMEQTRRFTPETLESLLSKFAFTPQEES